MTPKEKFPLLSTITGFFVAVLVLTPSAASKFIAIGSFYIDRLYTLQTLKAAP